MFEPVTTTGPPAEPPAECRYVGLGLGLIHGRQVFPPTVLLGLHPGE